MLKPISNQQAYEMIKKQDIKNLFAKTYNFSDDARPSFSRFDRMDMKAKDIGKYEFFIYEEIKN